MRAKVLQQDDCPQKNEERKSFNKMAATQKGSKILNGMEQPNQKHRISKNDCFHNHDCQADAFLFLYNYYTYIIPVLSLLELLPCFLSAQKIVHNSTGQLDYFAIILLSLTDLTYQ